MSSTFIGELYLVAQRWGTSHFVCICLCLKCEVLLIQCFAYSHFWCVYYDNDLQPMLDTVMNLFDRYSKLYREEVSSVM